MCSMEYWKRAGVAGAWSRGDVRPERLGGELLAQK